MDIKKVQKFNKKKELETENSAFNFITNLFKGIGNIFSSAIQMEKDGLSERLIIGQIEGYTKRNKRMKIKYGLRTKIGLGDFINRDIKSRGDQVALRDKSK